MNDYMTALHQRFYRDPDVTELEKELEPPRQKVWDCLDKLQRCKLMHLSDLRNLLQEKTSLASFTAGFQLAWGTTISGLPSAPNPYTHATRQKQDEAEAAVSSFMTQVM